jgi:hypothetical protein
MESARSAASAAVQDWCAREGVDCEGVWSEWQLPMPA